MNHSIVVKPTEINSVGHVVPEPEELSGGTQAMKECPRFDRCNALICPLDPDVLDRVSVKGDSVCQLPQAIRQKRPVGPKTGERTGKITHQSS